MYFKRLEMFGFKSFAERTKINFERGITAIIGPNGCGKSNIADAVKWVLGEQSAKALRGSSMQDVIFNGTDLREPLGYAEVSLTLSNEAKFLPIEYDEVTISRRLYRSGESEYLINKNPVRLKDIDELFMGSGIGTTAYSLVEQGQIDQILSTNPEERRIVFEEASGITKYKSKKKEAVRRLEYTEQNLLRLNDITKEVERQINSIERQAKKASRYQELFSRLKELDTGLAAYKYSELKEKKDNLENENTNIKDKEAELNNYVVESNKELEELNSKLDNLESKISGYRSDHKDTTVSLQRNQHEIRLDRERLHELGEHQVHQKNEIDSLNKRIAEITNSIDDITNKLTQISENTRSKENLLVAKEKELSDLKDGIAKSKESIKNNRFKAVDIVAVQSRFRNEITKITSDMQNVSARLRRLNLERENVLKELTTLDKGLSEARLSVNMTISKVEVLEKERVIFQNNLKKEQDGFTLLEKRINDSKNYIFTLHSKLSFLKDLLKRHEGFTGGTQAFLDSLSSSQLKIDSFCEPLAELLEPKTGYEAACEAALIANIQAIAIDDWNTAFLAIDYLKKNNLGKASFIKNDSLGLEIKPSSLDNRLILGNIMDFMRFEPGYKPLFTKLLKETFLVNSIEDGLSVFLALGEDLKERLKLVTPKGDIITKDIITGGSAIQDFTLSIIGRQKKIKETENHIEESEKEVLKLKQELHIKKELIEDFKTKMKKVEETLRIEEIDLARRRSAEANLEKEHRKIKEEEDLVDLEIEETVFRQNELKDKEIELRTKLEEAGKEELHLQNLLTNSQAFIEEGANKKEELLVTITQIQTEISSLRNQEDEFLNRAQAQQSYYQDQLKILNAKGESLEESSHREKELKEQIEKLEWDTKHLEERQEVIERELKILEDESQQLKGVTDRNQKALSKFNAELNTIKDRNHNLEMEKAQLSFQMESLKNKIDQLYKVDLLQIAVNLKIDDIHALGKEIDELSQILQKIGPVNLVAIDEHKELGERLSFLKHQHEDLTNAKESLLKAIRKINQTTKELFMETFNTIQVEFKNYFRFLFGGGKAELVLLDERDVLECGIEIIVRPPGKKLQTISLLSGGEKALTATALLFAVFKVKPSPFCLLDEIDAPLDESNISRFSKVLQEFAKASQFIIITHNKKTIGIADVMYGITMEQSGVSKIISVKFGKKTEEEKEAILLR